MMKPIVMILVVVGCSFSAFADNTPSELKHLQSIRAKKIKEIDDAYIKALEKLKVKYTKRGDLESAIAVSNCLKAMVSAQTRQTTLSSTENQATNARVDPATTTKQLPKGTKTREIDSGIIAFIKAESMFSMQKAMQDAKQYGGEVFAPDTDSELKHVKRVLASVDGWLNLGAVMYDGEIQFYAGGKKSTYDYENCPADLSGYRCNELRNGQECGMFIKKNGALEIHKKNKALQGYYIFIPN